MITTKNLIRKEEKVGQKGRGRERHRESKKAEQVFDGHVTAGRDRGKNRGKARACKEQRDKREAEDRSVHLSTFPSGNRRRHPLLPGAQVPGCSSAGTPHHCAPLHGPISHCQGPAAAQFITATFGNYPCKHGVIPPGKGLIADTVWAASAKTAGIWAVCGLTPETQAQGRVKNSQ